jgi:3',5'-cyclic-AMP phosphodiesterase
MLDRRTLLAAPLSLASAADSFTFVHVTDLHIQPELNAIENCDRCMEKINSVQPAFTVTGGDLIFDANLTGPDRARQLVGLYQKTIGRLKGPVHQAIGNHDLFGIGDRGKPGPMRAAQARKSWESDFGPRFYKFDHRGWRFIVLDSIHLPAEGGYLGWIDPDQIKWLDRTLAGASATPTVIITHVPLVTGFLQYGDLAGKYPANTLVVDNAREVTDIIVRHNVKAVLQGHTHVCENVHYRGCQYVTTGAVCGDWWRGPRLGFPNGFTKATISGTEISFTHVAY